MVISESLEKFRTENNVNGKGPLCVMIVVTEHAKAQGLPLNSEKLVTPESGQVLGLGKSAVQAVLQRHGITKILAKEGGRTSRGSIGLMKRYVDFLNIQIKDKSSLETTELWWIERVTEYMNSGGFILNYDSSKSLRSVVEDLIAQAQKLQTQRRGATYVGAMLQHMVGAKLELALKDKVSVIEHNGYSVADAPTGRTGDFTLDDVVIHVTASPSEGLIQKCKANLKVSHRPIIITTFEMVPGAISLSKVAEINERVDVIDAGQFIAMNLYEISGFKAINRRITIDTFVAKYNQIVSTHETDPSLRLFMRINGMRS